MSEDKRVGRRAFFRFGLREIIRPVDAAGPAQRIVRELGRFSGPAARGEAATPAEPATAAGPPGATGPIGPIVPVVPVAPVPRSVPLVAWLRPPGAIEEGKFIDTCSRCGECVRVCPAQCIKIDPRGVKGGGLPYIEPDAMACVVCEGLQCMPMCPTGALVPTLLAEIDMGTAQWRGETCVRSRGEPCTICVDRCPVGEAAIKVTDGNIAVLAEGCIGCGVCQHECPTSPKSIVVVPRQAREFR